MKGNYVAEMRERERERESEREREKKKKDDYRHTGTQEQ